MMSDVRTFRTQLPTGPDGSFSFVVYGDMRVSAVPGAHDTAKYMIEEVANGSSFVFHVGDISYARGYVSGGLETRSERRFCCNAIPYMIYIMHSQLA